ncbi:hypothetical protein Kpol_2002p89 [Vanderwaltozyma polyspora DSM 70294]|uniref:Alcohol acetyltransferase n=1 Tax=Vanderwaltozyma polyspora (strain ATCC 22028 / DSM 70294 / BCRC 21397 / CBS 2163 / NBRC 10782 / NRRL Y-8283 / UCD 57-17) TaxID=436907 RepID=A7TFK4_VANPO|nr:uncharacterized protein Kpol_2002p89 [Vanderwaltozyma polyspora DSM 70294]EDO19018.1 hypothetical protein Kpol_2002p89 [Vanderwaltozyma polyspora DSM 70294]
MEEYAPFITQELVDRGHARRMGQLENYFALLQRQNLYKNFNVYGEINEPIDKFQLGTAFRQMLLKYPILMHVIVPRKYPHHEEYYASDEYLNNPQPINDYIKVMENIDLEDILLNSQPEYEAIVGKLLDQYKSDGYKYTNRMIEIIGDISIPICDQTKPNWRLLCLPTKESDKKWHAFVYISNHCAADGMTSMNFFHDIVNGLNDKSSETVTEVNGRMNLVNYAKDHKNISKFPKPITERVEYRPSLSQLPKFMIGNIARTKLNYKSPCALTTTVDKVDMQTFDYILNFTNEEVGKIRKHIKANTHNGVTLTPFLQTCLFVTLYQFGTIFQKTLLEWGLDSVLPVNARKYLPEDAELRDSYKYGSNVGGIHYFNLISSFNIKNDEAETFWSLVDYYHANYQKAYHNGDTFVGFGLLMSDFIVKNKNVDKLIKEDYVNQKRGGVILSNLGFFPQDTRNEYYLNDLIFAQTFGSMKFTFGLSLCSTNVNGLNIGISVVRDAFNDRETFEKFCKHYKETIINFANL